MTAIRRPCTAQVEREGHDHTSEGSWNMGDLVWEWQFQPSLMAQIYNPSCSGGKGRRIMSSNILIFVRTVEEYALSPESCASGYYSLQKHLQKLHFNTVLSLSTKKCV